MVLSYTPGHVRAAGRPSTVGKARRWGVDGEENVIRFGEPRSWDASTIPYDPGSWYDDSMELVECGLLGKAR